MSEKNGKSQEIFAGCGEPLISFLCVLCALCGELINREERKRAQSGLLEKTTNIY